MIPERFTRVYSGFTKLVTASDFAINEDLHSFELQMPSIVNPLNVGLVVTRLFENTPAPAI